MGLQCLRILIVFLGLSFHCTPTAGARILLYPYGHCFNSHLLNMEKLGQILISAGHEVSMIMSQSYKTVGTESITQTNQTVKVLPFQGPQDFTPVCIHDDMDYILHAPLPDRFDHFIKTAAAYCDRLIGNKEFMQNLKSAKFDLFVVEAIDPCSRVLADFMDIPFIPFFSTGLGHWDGNPRLPSYIPSTIAPLTPDMCFSERVQNFIMKLAYELIPVFLGFDRQFEAIKKRHDINTSLSLADTFKRATLKFANSDFAVDYPAPLEPDTIMIGGFFLHEPKALSEDLELFMNSAGPAGVVIMSFGTITKRFNKHWTTLFAEAFKSLPQKVIWKYELNEENKNWTKQYDNIRFVKWLPQIDLLAHPQTKLFITHCGLSSVFEAAYFGVPVVAIPLFADQFHHATKLTDYLQMGVQLNAHKLTSETLYDAMKTVLGNQQYKLNAKAVSSRMHQQPMTKAEKIKFWVNFVLSNKGQNHLKSVAHRLAWYQYFCLDIISFLGLIILSVVTTALYIIFKLIQTVIVSMSKAQNVKIKMS